MSLIKQECVINGEINREKLVTISGITPGKCVTLGSIRVELSGLPCEAQVISDDFPIDTDGLLGWDMLAKHGIQVNSANKWLEAGQLVIPFEREEEFIIPSHTRQVIYARVQNKDTKVGLVPLQKLGPKLLLGNFVAENREGKIHALCYNISEETIRIKAPIVTLEPCEMMREKDEVFSGPNIDDFGELGHANVLQLLTDDEEDRATRIFEALDADTLKDLNEEEIAHIKELIREQPHIFGLPGVT